MEAGGFISKSRYEFHIRSRLPWYTYHSLVTLSTASLLEGLNRSQIGAVTRTGPLLVVAGPGSGKTLAMVRRIAYLVLQGVRAEKIVAVTFTNRAAREMQERLRALLAGFSDRIFVGTLHLLGLRILREILGRDIVIYDRKAQLELLRSLLGGSATEAAKTADRISRVKNLMDGPDSAIEPVFQRYQQALAEAKAFDFDDLIVGPSALLGEYPEVLERLQRLYSHIIVDEYQDISPCQHKLLRMLAGNSATVCAVGDPDQAIYGFRGADVRNFLNFKEDFPEAREIALCVNYRCSGNIVASSDAMIRHNSIRVEREVYPFKENGNPIVFASVPDEVGEGEYIVKEIEARLGGLTQHNQSSMVEEGGIRSSYSFSDFAIMFRMNSQADELKKGLERSGIPCNVLRWGYTTEEGNGKDLIGRLHEYARTSAIVKELKEMRTGQLLEYFIIDNNCSVDQRGELAGDLEVLLGKGWKEVSVLDLMDLLCTFGPGDDFDPKADAVVLMTLHMAKGLEFRVVFISGVDDGIIPYRGGRHTDLEEERRLLYVGMTRAREELVLVHRRNVFFHGRRACRAPSPFLAEIPKNLLREVTIPDRRKGPRQKKQVRLF